jgi:Ca-activated chloride channel family protein
VTITGQRSGKTERYSSRVTFSTGDDANDFIPRLWASRKLGELTRRVHLQGSSPELIDEIKSTALRYGLLSEYTSYFVSENQPVSLRGDRNPLIPRDQVSSKSIVAGETIDKLPAAAPAPTAATGSAAVASAESARKQREVTTTADIVAQQKAVMSRLEMPTNGLAQVDVSTGGVSARFGGDADSRRVIAGRSFIRRDSVWMDAGIDPRNRIVEVPAFSDAYFTVLRALPELKSYTSMGDVAIAGAAVTIRFTTASATVTGTPSTTKLTTARVAELVRQFRGKS